MNLFLMAPVTPSNSTPNIESSPAINSILIPNMPISYRVLYDVWASELKEGLFRWWKGVEANHAWIEVLFERNDAVVYY